MKATALHTDPPTIALIPEDDHDHHMLAQMAESWALQIHSYTRNVIDDRITEMRITPTKAMKKAS
ncbi:MAG: hypothetical protein C4521_07610 [Actinobacteria bacterium]|nr:MAG: hypothetical protein C4521_07610 [Actinomycetota bacterium]